MCPCDLQVLAASAGGAFNVLHVCGRALDFRRFAVYPATPRPSRPRTCARSAAPWER